MLWSNSPARDQLLDTITITQWSYVDFDVTSAITSAQQAGQSKVTPGSKTVNQSEMTQVYSSSQANKPELVVTTIPPDTVAPTFTSAATSEGTKVILNYNEVLSATTASSSDFTVEVDEAASISSVATSGSAVELTLSLPSPTANRHRCLYRSKLIQRHQCNPR